MMEDRAAKINLLILDVDGVMTNGRVIMNDRGEETKSFCVKDGLGLKMLMSAGVEVALVTGRRSQVVLRRAEDLGIKHVYQGVADKRAICSQVIRDNGFKKQEVCCMGDDLPDLAMFMESGLRVAVGDAAEEVRDAADFITKSKGGNGAVREICELILRCQNKWDDMLAGFTGV